MLGAGRGGGRADLQKERNLGANVFLPPPLPRPMPSQICSFCKSAGKEGKAAGVEKLVQGEAVKLEEAVDGEVEIVRWR